MHIIDCTHAEQAHAILDILNDAIVSSTAIYDYEPRPVSSMGPWFAAKVSGGFPVLGAVDASGMLAGFATYGCFRERAAYKYSVEHSVYVHRERRGRGIGHALMRRLIDVCTEQQYHVMVGGLDAENAASIALHQKLGFAHAGTIQQAGYKFGRWLDLAFFQLLLPTPAEPRDG
jgi:L-amino acid N-acyltransferase YncA